MDSPILIASPTRCGTTMLAWLLHLHGVWIGKAGVTKAPETNPQVGTENTAIKEYMKTVSGAPDDFPEQIAKRVKTDGPWLFKSAQNLLKRQAWLKHFPDAKWILPNRDIDAIVASAMRHPGMRKAGANQRYQIAARHKAMQKFVADCAKHSIWIDSDKIARADETEGRRLLDFVGIPFDVEIFHGWIQPDRWHE